jgi:hypothetical protein
VSEQYTHLGGDDTLFHDGIMNQCEECLKRDIALVKSGLQDAPDMAPAEA